MAKNTLIFLVLLFSGCTSQMMTKPVYDTIPLGMRIEEVSQLAGEPYKVEKGQNGLQYYRYIERFEIGPGSMAQKTYVLTVSNGMVVDKQMIDSGSGVNFSTP